MRTVKFAAAHRALGAEAAEPTPSTFGAGPRTAVELGGLAVGFVLFTRLHDLAGTDIASATANALTLKRVERSLGIDIELASNDWPLTRP